MLYALALLALAAFSHAENLPPTAEGAAVVEYTGTKMDYSSEKRMLEVAWRWPGWDDIGWNDDSGARGESYIIAEPSAKAAVTHGAGSLIVGTLGVALVAALTLP